MPVSGPSGAHGRSALQRAEMESRPRRGASRRQPRVVAFHAQGTSPRSRTAMSMFAHHATRPPPLTVLTSLTGFRTHSTKQHKSKKANEHKYKFFEVILVLCGVK